MAIINFNAAQVAPDSGQADPVPAGWYGLLAKSFELKPGQNGAGLNVQFEVMYPEQYKGRKVYHNFNIENTSEKAQQIGQAQLSALCYAVNRVGLIQDTAVLQDIPFAAKLSLKPAEGEYAAKNEIKAFKPMAEMPAPSASVGAVAPVNRPSPTGVVTPPAPVAPPQQAWGQPQQAPVQQPPAQASPVQQAWAAPAQQAPVQQAPVQQAAPAAQWQPPAAQQPWQDPAQQQAPVQQAAPQQQAWNPAQQDPALSQQMQPVQQQAPAGQPAWAAAPVNDPNVQQGAQTSGAPVQAMTTAPSPAATAAQTAPPPWAQPQ